MAQHIWLKSIPNQMQANDRVQLTHLRLRLGVPEPCSVGPDEAAG